MNRQSLLNILALLVCFVAFLHLLATSFYLYWTFWWYDIILHFLGGAFAGLLFVWMRFFSGYFGIPPFPSNTKLCWFLIMTTLIVGVGWEVFERLLGHTWSIEGYWLDTSTDILLDMLGAVAAYFLITRKRL